MRLEPGQQRGFVKREGFGVVEMASGALGGRTAGMKDAGAAFDRKAGKFKFLESDGGDGGNLGPMFDGFGGRAARFTESAKGLVLRKLEGEQGKGELIEAAFQIGRGQRWRGSGMLGDAFAQLRGEIRKCTGRYHAVFKTLPWLVFRDSRGEASAGRG